MQESKDQSASYHFARQLEVQGELREAINFYASSGCYNHAIRLARSFNLDSEVMKYAMQAGSSSIMLDCASYFESKQEFDKAVQLYHKGGDLPRALDLCFRAAADFSAESNTNTTNKTTRNSSNANSASSPQAAAMFEMINVIAADLGENSSPQTLARCADFLVQNKQFPKVA